MSEHPDVFAVCDWCELPIYFGNAEVTVNLNIEQVDRPGDYPDGQITVIQSDALLTLCAPCGNRLDREKLRSFLHSGTPRS